MNVLGISIGKTKKDEEPKRRGRGERGPNKSANERLKQEELRFLRDLRGTDPDAYRDLQIQKLKKRYGISVAKGQSLDQADIAISFYKKLKEAGITVDPNKAADHTFSQELMKALPMVIGGLGNFFQQQAAVNITPQSQPSSTYQQPQIQPPAAVEYEGGKPPTPTAAAELPQSPAEENMSPESAWLIANLGSKAPPEAAAWLLAQPQTVQLVTALKTIPEEHLGALVIQYADANETLAPFFRWIQTRWEWTLSVVREIKGTPPPSHVNGESRSRFGFDYSKNPS